MTIGYSCHQYVLILVVMDDALAQNNKIMKRQETLRVLILVVMDDALALII